MNTNRYEETLTELISIQVLIPTQTDALQVAYIISNKCKSTVWAVRNEYRVNAKSVLGLLSLDISQKVSLVFNSEEDYQRVVEELDTWRVYSTETKGVSE